MPGEAVRDDWYIWRDKFDELRQRPKRFSEAGMRSAENRRIWEGGIIRKHMAVLTGKNLGREGEEDNGDEPGLST
jgi:hypothetical protein